MKVLALGPTALAVIAAPAVGTAELAMAVDMTRAVEVSGMRVNALGEFVVIEPHR